jgi:hypothetical protein
MTRDNPNVELPEGGSAFSGIGRARLLKNVRVNIADLASEDSKNGKIGPVRLDPEAKSLSKDRVYV